MCESAPGVGVALEHGARPLDVEPACAKLVERREPQVARERLQLVLRQQRGTQPGGPIVDLALLQEELCTCS